MVKQKTNISMSAMRSVVSPTGQRDDNSQTMELAKLEMDKQD